MNEKQYSGRYDNSIRIIGALKKIMSAFCTITSIETLPLQNTDFRSNSKPEEKLSLQFTGVNETFDFFDNDEVTFKKLLCKGLGS